MSIADDLYCQQVKDILDNGLWDKDQNVRPKWADRTPAYTKAIIGTQLKFDNSEVPILTQKEVKWKAAIKELLWIWQLKSNRVQDLRDMGVNIWNQWELSDGTIGRAYGWQLANKKRKLIRHEETATGGKYTPIMVDQVDYLLWELANKPSSRRIKTTLWCVEDLDEMALTPCVYETHWIVKEGKLHLIVNIRSNDCGLGNPFNVFQYYVLQRMIAQVTNYQLGTLTYNIDDLHIYDRHVDSLSEQINLPKYEAPTLWLNPYIKDFYDFTIDDFRLDNYHHGKFIRMEVAV